ncbi:hypothetical protein D3C86_287330 [compost metagenome]
MRGPGGERAHGDARVVDGVHPDAIAQEGTAGLALAGVHREDRDGLLREVDEEAPHQLVGEAGLACAAGTRDTQDGHGAILRLLLDLVKEVADPEVLMAVLGLGQGDEAGDRVHVADLHLHAMGRKLLGHVDVAGLDHEVDHALQAHAAAVLGREDLGDAIGFQLGNFGRDDHAAATAEDLDMAGAALAQQVDHVLEVLEVTALVRGEGDALRVLLDRRVHDFGDAAVMAEVDDFDAGGLENPPHDVDGGVVSVEERGGRDEADLVTGLVGRNRKIAAIRGPAGGSFHDYSV